MKPRTLFLLIPLILGALTQSVSACPICMGGQDSPTASAVNNAIFIMFGVLGLIFSGIGSVVFSLYRRAKSQGKENLDSLGYVGTANGLTEAKQHA